MQAIRKIVVQETCHIEKQRPAVVRFSLDESRQIPRRLESAYKPFGQLATGFICGGRSTNKQLRRVRFEVLVLHNLIAQNTHVGRNFLSG